MLLWPFNKYPGTDYETYNWEWLIGLGKKMEKALHDLFSDTGALHQMVDKVLGEHPEWTTTVMDGAITLAKLAPSLAVRMNLLVTPMDFNAMGDGITDDTNAIQAAFNSSAPLVCIDRDYICGAVLMENIKNKIIFSSGKTLKFPDGTDNQRWFSLVKCENIIIENINFNGNRDQQTIVTTGDVRFYTENCPCILIDECKHIRVDTCNIYDEQGDGVQIDKIYYNQLANANNLSHDIKINNCTFDSVGRNGVSVIHAHNVTVSNNSFSNIQLYSTSIACAVDVEPNSAAGFDTTNITVRDNNIDQCRTGVSVAATGSATLENVVVDDNKITNTRNPLYTNVTTGYTVFTNNVISECVCGIYTDQAINVVYKNNVVHSLNGTTESFANCGFYPASPIEDVVIEGNYFDCDGLYTILMSNQCENVRIINNTLKGDHSGGVHIFATGTTNNIEAVYNTIEGQKQAIALNGANSTAAYNTLKDSQSVTANKKYLNTGPSTFSNTETVACTANTRTYTGMSVTIPANSAYSISARISWSDGMPTRISLSTSNTDDSDASTGRLAAPGVGRTCVSGYTTSELTVYLWGTWSGSGNNQATLSGWIWPNM